MTNSDCIATFALIAKLWPKAAWVSEVQTEMARRVRSVQISYAQAHAALVNLRIQVKFATIQPGEVLNALTNAAGMAQGGVQGGGGDPTAKRDAEALAGNRERLERLGNEWLALQGWKFAHWEPGWLVQTNEPCKWHWGARFVAWTRGRA